LAEAFVQLGKLGNVALEQFAQMGDLSDQLLVGTGLENSSGLGKLRRAAEYWS
jgi:hypothetical protein